LAVVTHWLQRAFKNESLASKQLAEPHEPMQLWYAFRIICKDDSSFDVLISRCIISSRGCQQMSSSFLHWISL